MRLAQHHLVTATVRRLGLTGTAPSSWAKRRAVRLSVLALVAAA